MVWHHLLIQFVSARDMVRLAQCICTMSALFWNIRWSALILITDAFRYVCRRLTVLAACTWPSLGFVQPSC